MRTERMETYGDSTNQSEEDQEFRQRMIADAVMLREGETVTEFIHRVGFPYSLHPVGERRDN